MPESQTDIHADFRKTQTWKDKLYKSLCHKSLDIPETDLNINQHGITGKHLVWIAGLILTGLLGWRALAPDLKSSLDDIPPAVQEFEVSFWAEDGTEIEVEESKFGQKND